MAAIAEAESGGCSAAFNPSGATGLWQILGNPFPGDAYDPATNAKMAVAKYQSQGLTAWETYTNGAYKAYLNPGTSPVLNVPGPVGGPQPGAGAGSPDCLFPPSGGFNIPTPIGYTQTINLPCLFTKSNARAFLGAGFLAGGFLLLALPGAAILAAAAGSRALGAAGPVLTKTGAVVALVPGAEGAGAAIAGAGKASSSSAEATKHRRAARRADRKTVPAKPAESETEPARSPSGTPSPPAKRRPSRPPVAPGMGPSKGGTPPPVQRKRKEKAS